jgi:hypothetical protein
MLDPIVQAVVCFRLLLLATFSLLSSAVKSVLFSDNTA